MGMEKKNVSALRSGCSGQDEGTLSRPPLANERGNTVLACYCLSEEVWPSCDFCDGFVLVAADVFPVDGLLTLVGDACVGFCAPVVVFADTCFSCAVLG